MYVRISPMGNRSGSENRKLSEQVNVRFTPEEKTQIQAWANEWMISPAELLRISLYENEFAKEHGLNSKTRD